LVLDAAVAQSGPQAQALWRLRESCSEAQKPEGASIKHDVSVPVSRVPQFLAAATEAVQAAMPGARVVAFGHAGDGNIHVNLMIDARNSAQRKKSEHALDQLFKQVLTWNGVITGEHGIGLAKKRWWPLALTSETRELHRRMKVTLDPHGILNPGKFV
jgi:FAD/FMN-containing dehydrogenase